MKLSISLPDEDVAILDAFAPAAGFPSRPTRGDQR